MHYFEFPPADVILTNNAEYRAETKTIYASMTGYRQPAPAA